jgi:Putative Ig domain
MLNPTNTGGAATTWMVSPALPPGLSFSTANGSISGTPTATAAPTTYTVVAQNSGGSDAVQLTLRVQAVLVDLGHVGSIVNPAMSGSAVLSEDGYGWIIWDYTTGRMVAQNRSCGPTYCGAGHAELAGTTAVVQELSMLIGVPDRIEAYSALTGDLLGSLPTVPAWWHVSSDGSYICGAAPAMQPRGLLPER